jgi:hypothetical protein
MQLSIFDALGHRLLNDFPFAVNNSKVWEWQINTSNWASGMYFFIIENETTKQTGKILISKGN